MSLYRISDSYSGAADYDPELQGLERKGAQEKSKPQAPPGRLEQHMEKVVRLIPGDVVAGYLTVRSFWLAGADNSVDHLAGTVIRWWLPIGGIAATAILRIFGTTKRLGTFDDVQWSTTFAATISFVAWAFALNDPIFGLGTDPRVRSTVLVLVSLLAPVFVSRGKE